MCECEWATLYWVFGASGVGKKTFITRAAQGLVGSIDFEKPIGEVWVQQGELHAHELAEACDGLASALIRWQWNREFIVPELSLLRPDYRHVVVMLEVPSRLQSRRIIRREGFEKWDRLSLHREARSVRQRANEMAERHGLELLRISAKDFRYRLKG